MTKGKNTKGKKTAATHTARHARANFATKPAVAGVESPSKRLPDIGVARELLNGIFRDCQPATEEADRQVRDFLKVAYLLASEDREVSQAALIAFSNAAYERTLHRIEALNEFELSVEKEITDEDELAV